MPPDDVAIELAVRRARMDAARTSSATVAAMAAGAGAELVARAQFAREVLERRMAGPRPRIEDVLAAIGGTR